MDRRTAHHITPARLIAIAGVFLFSSTMLGSVSGCKAIREHRAQRAAERQADKQVSASSPEQPGRTLPNGNADANLDETQAQWMQRQQVVQASAQTNPAREPVRAPAPEPEPVSEPIQEPARESSPEPEEPRMKIVDDRPSARQKPSEAQSDEPAVEIIEPEPRRVFDRRTKDEKSYDRAVEMHASGDLDSALRELERAIAINPQFTRAFLEAGDIYLELAQYEQAERQFALAVRSEPRSFIAQYRHGQVLHRLGRLQEANRAYLRALSIRPGDFDANLGISIVLLEMGRTEQALPYGQRAVKSDPPSGRARMHLGNVYAAIDRHEEAIIEYQQAAELMDAPTAGLLLNMADSLNTLGRYAEMVGALDQLVRLDPDAIAYERLGSGLFRLKRYEESLDAFRKSAEIDPTHYPAFNGIAVCELNAYLWSSKTDAGARERAVEAMRKSLRIERKQPRIVELLRRYAKASSTEK